MRGIASPVPSLRITIGSDFLHDSTIHDGREIIPVIKSSEEMIRIFNINI